MYTHRAQGDAYVRSDPQALGHATRAFVQVAVEGQENEQAFLVAVMDMLEVQEIHHVSGEFPLLLKLWARDIAHLEDLLHNTLKVQTGVRRVQISVVLSSPKDHVTGLNAKP